MLIRIRETQELGNLSYPKRNHGTDCTKDILGNNDALHYNAETEEHEMGVDEYEWWKEYLEKLEADEEEVAELAEELDIDEDELWNRIYEYMDSEMDNQSSYIQAALKEIREEYGIKKD